MILAKRRDVPIFQLEHFGRQVFGPIKVDNEPSMPLVCEDAALTP